MMWHHLQRPVSALAIRRALGDYALPSSAASVAQALTVAQDPSASSRHLVNALQSDPGVAVQVLRTVNSAAFGLPRSVSDLRQAVIMLGRSELTAVILTLLAQRTVAAVQVPGFDSGAFWKAATRRASTAKALALRLHPRTASASYLGGLLGDLGVAVLAAARPRRFAMLQQPAGSAEAIEQERRLFGYDHAEVGAWACAHWNLPDDLVKLIAGHHVDPSVPLAVRLVSHLRGADAPEDELAFLHAAAQVPLDLDGSRALLEESWEAAAPLVA